MIVAKSSVHDCSQTDYPATRGPALPRGLALVGGTDMPAQRRGPAEQTISVGTFHLLLRQRLSVEDGHPVHLGGRALDMASSKCTNAHDGRRLSGGVTWRTE